MFRKEAIENRKMKWKGRAILLPGVPFWLVSALCLFFVIAFLIFVIAGTYTRRVSVSGEITSDPRPVKIFSPEQGFITRQFVSAAQRVKKGDPLYQIDVSKSTLNGVLSDNQRQNIGNQLQRVDDIIARLKESKSITLKSLERQRLMYSDALTNSRDILAKAREGIRIMKNNMSNYQDYQRKGLINKDQLTNQIAIYYQQQNNLLNLSGQNEQNALQLTSLESQILTQSADFDNRIYQMELQRFELEKEMANADASGEIIIRALSDGKIDSLSVTPGQMVSAGSSLLQIIPQTIKDYYLVLWVPNDAVPYISRGDKLNVRYEAFPAEKFGQFSATIALISRTPASPQEMETYQGAPDTRQGLSVPYYKVLAKPALQQISYGDKSMPLENGMKGQATLFLEKRRIYQWMLSPFYDMKQSAAGPVNEH